MTELPTGVPTRAEVHLLLDTATQPRDHLMIRILYFSGIRKGELLALQAGDVLWDLRSLFIRSGKGDKDRYVLLDPVTLAMLADYAGEAPPEQLLFDLSQYWGDNNFKKYCEECGLYQRYQSLGLRLSVHSLRHAFATHRYERGLDFWTVHALLGHVFVDDTGTYLRTASAQIANAYASCSPFSSQRSPTPLAVPPPSPAQEHAEEIAREFALQPDALRPNGLPAVPTPSEITALLDAAGPFLPAFRTLYATGLWVAQLQALQPEDILDQELRLQKRTVRIDAGTQAMVRLPFPEQLEAAFLETAARTGLARRFAGIARTLGIDSLRHAFATHCCQNGMDRISLMQQLGHRFLGTTEVYFRTAANRYLAAYDATTEDWRPISKLQMTTPITSLSMEVVS